jgi:cytochrome c oxidase accessory protein FixG
MTKPPPVDPASEKPDPSGAAQTVNWADHRDHLATADKEGHRQWVYAKKPSGRWYTRRTVFAWVLIVGMFAGPWVRINGNPLLLFNIIERKFSILGQIFWPSDTIIFAVAMLLFITSIIVFTSAYGRLWCGWACPQTVMMEMVFRKLEYLIEGDSHAQRKLNAAPWTVGKIVRKVFKQVVFFGLSLIVANTLLAYIIGSDALLAIQVDDPRNHMGGLGAMVVFTFVFYGIFARFREQACTFICPYGRLQSVLLDENSMIVAYDHKRGDKRSPLHRGQTTEQREAEGQGDCISCQQCVVVCPTGIDIRDGVQMECVHCTACIDACDTVMDKIKRPRGLIRYASLNGIEKNEPLRFTPRMRLYAIVLTILTTLFFVLVFTRADVETLLLRAPGGMFQALPDGRIQNLYTVKIVNKTSHDIPITLRLEGSEGELSMIGNQLNLPGQDLAKTSVLIKLPRNEITGANTKVKVGVYNGDELLETVKTVFVGPRNLNVDP